MFWPPDRCETENYFPLSNEKFVLAKTVGAISADIPDEAVLSGSEKLAGYWGWVLVCLVAFLVVLTAIKRRQRAKKRKALMGDMSPVAHQMIDAICHAAKVDGNIDAAEIEAIRKAAQKISGQPFSVPQITKIAELAEKHLDEKGFKKFVKGADLAQKEAILRAVLHVVAADGQLNSKEQEFIAKLARAAKIPADRIDELFKEMKANEL
jgi:tellurite resistance protein